MLLKLWVLQGIYDGAANRAGSALNSTKRASPSSGIKCFACGELGYRQAECKWARKKVMFAETYECDEGEDALVDGDPIFDTEAVNKKLVTGDVGTALVVRRSCLTSKAVDDDWLRSNIFQSTCTIRGKVCRFVIDAGSCENLISGKVV